MPIMDGPAATKAIRALGYKGCIIGISGQVQEDDKRTFLDAGADVVLPKPVDVKTLEVLLGTCRISRAN